MRGMWKHLERLGGGRARRRGVGTRGPGESQLETDRRIARPPDHAPQPPPAASSEAARRRDGRSGAAHADARRRARRLHERRQVDAAERAHGRRGLASRTASSRRSTRRRAASSTTASRYLVTDTVGFIRRLPTQLVEGFASTLEETLVADLVLHVADASAPDERLDGDDRGRRDACSREIGADELPVELVLNKIDRVDPLGRRRLANAFPGALQISARDRRGRRASCGARIAERFADRFEDGRSCSCPYDEGARLAELYALGAPIEEREDREEGVLVRARLPRRELAPLRARSSSPSARRAGDGRRR